MIIESLAEYLENNSIGVVGTDIFIGELPVDKNDCISLIYTPSPEPNKSIPYYVQSIDVRARFAKYSVGYQKLSDVLGLIHRAENYEMEGYHVYLSYSTGMITDNDRDVQRRHLFQLSLNFVYRVSEGS